MWRRNRKSFLILFLLKRKFSSILWHKLSSAHKNNSTFLFLHNLSVQFKSLCLKKNGLNRLIQDFQIMGLLLLPISCRRGGRRKRRWRRRRCGCHVILKCLSYFLCEIRGHQGNSLLHSVSHRLNNLHLFREVLGLAQLTKKLL